MARDNNNLNNRRNINCNNDPGSGFEWLFWLAFRRFTTFLWDIMKTYKNLYSNLCSYENLLLAYKKARKRKTNKDYVKEFERDLEKNLKELQHELETSAYFPRSLTTFVIRDPKTRVISASHFRDRVVHHAICNILEPIFEKSFIYDSFANRKGKGTHPAIIRFEGFVRKVSGNGRLLPDQTNRNAIMGYALKADIRRYFDTVDNEVLIGILERKIRDARVICLVRKILQNHKASIPGKGMPLGNLTSQFFANVYLNELDHFVKHELKARHYLRYVDDFVLLHARKEILMGWLKKINEFLAACLKIELHPEKSKVVPLRKGITLLGFRIFFSYRLLKKSNANRIWKHLERLRRKLDRCAVTREQTVHSFCGWLAYARFANTYNFRRKVAAEFNRLFVNHNWQGVLWLRIP